MAVRRSFRGYPEHAQLTLPEEIRRALHISEGDEVEFAVHDDGTITVRGYVSIPTDQAWFFTPQWLAGEREADKEMTQDSDGRATFSYGAEHVSGQPHVSWRRIGTHDIFTPPPGA